MNYKSTLVEENINILKNNITLFYGENLGLKSDLKSQIKKRNRGSEVFDFYQEDILKNENLIFEKIFNKSLFNETKIFFINQCSEKILDIIKTIETKLDDQKIFLLSDILEKKSKLRNYFEKSSNLNVVPCYADNEATLKKIILKKLAGFNGLNNQTIKTLIDACGLDRIKLNNELNKVLNLFSNKTIEEKKLEALLDFNINDDFSVLKDQALLGNKTKTNKLLSETILETDKHIFYLSTINLRLVKLLEIRKMIKNISLNEAIDSLRPPIFWKDKPIFTSQVEKWNSDKIKNLLNKTVNLELRLKSSSLIDHQLLIKKLILDMCRLANS